MNKKNIREILKEKEILKKLSIKEKNMGKVCKIKKTHPIVKWSDIFKKSEMKNNKKYIGRKKYSKEEAEQQIENCFQMRSVLVECIHTWITKPRDALIEALCRQTTEKMLDEAFEKIEYIDSKIKYMLQFSEGYIPKGSFAYFSVRSKKAPSGIPTTL